MFWLEDPIALEENFQLQRRARHYIITPTVLIGEPNNNKNNNSNNNNNNNYNNLNDKESNDREEGELEGEEGKKKRSKSEYGTIR